MSNMRILYRVLINKEVLFFRVNKATRLWRSNEFKHNKTIAIM